jgi:hypothetical protein
MDPSPLRRRNVQWGGFLLVFLSLLLEIKRAAEVLQKGSIEIIGLNMKKESSKANIILFVYIFKIHIYD